MKAAAGRPALDWDAVLDAGLCRLRLPPAQFWTMTPREFAAACGVLMRRAGPMVRADLDALMRRFPDS